MANLGFKKFFLLVVLIFLISPVLQLAGQPMMPMPGMDDSRSQRGRPGREPRSRDRRSGQGDTRMDGEARDASDDISFKLQTVLKVVNSGELLQDADTKVIEKTLAEAKRYFPTFSPESQCQYHLLSAWANHFAHKQKKALTDAEKAFQADGENENAQATRWAMSILNKDYRILKELAQEGSSIFTAETQVSRRPQRTGRRGSDSDEDLNLDPASIKAELFGKTIQTVQLRCLNSSTLSYTPGDSAMCILFWKLPSGESSDASEGGYAMPGMAMPQRSRRSGRNDGTSEVYTEQIEAFAKLFLAEMENSSIRFLAVNVDAIDMKPQVVAQLFTNSWPWAHVMADDPANSAIAEFKSLEIKQPTLAIIAADSSICYAGQVTGFLPRLVITEVVSKINADSSHKEPLPEAAVDENVDTNSSFQEPPVEQETIGVDRQSDQTADTEQELILAEQVYQQAVGFNKVGRRTGAYKTMVESCRKILREYPQTPYAEKARQLLRRIPKRHRSKYDLTNEELGL